MIMLPTSQLHLENVYAATFNDSFRIFTQILIILLDWLYWSNPKHVGVSESSVQVFLS